MVAAVDPRRRRRGGGVRAWLGSRVRRRRRKLKGSEREGVGGYIRGCGQLGFRPRGRVTAGGSQCLSATRAGSWAG